MNRSELDFIAQRENLEAIRVRIKEASKSVERLLFLEKLVDMLLSENMLTRSGARSLKNRIQAASIRQQINIQRLEK